MILWRQKRDRNSVHSFPHYISFFRSQPNMLIRRKHTYTTYKYLQNSLLQLQWSSVTYSNRQQVISLYSQITIHAYLLEYPYLESFSTTVMFCQNYANVKYLVRDNIENECMKKRYEHDEVMVECNYKN